MQPEDEDVWVAHDKLVEIDPIYNIGAEKVQRAKIFFEKFVAENPEIPNK